MRIDLPVNESWNSVAKRLREHFQLPDTNIQVQAYAGFQHALHEATHGLAKLFSHKKTIALFGPIEPAIEAIVSAF